MTAFENEVKKGLSQYPKSLSSRFFYDKTGDAIFQEIMAMPEYYLTACEHEIISENKKTLAELFRNKKKGMDLIELGPGDGKKTKILLRYMSERNFNFTYRPVDISENALKLLTRDLSTELPGLQVDPENGEYFEVLKELKQFDKRKKVIMVLGSNIGNLEHPTAVRFLTKLRNAMAEEDLLFMGFDQKKNPGTILEAYNDKSGITERFNKNILVRINKEMNADFDPEDFLHWESYNPETGTAKSFLVAKKPLTVTIKKLDLTVNFDQWESIHTEISQKYDSRSIQWLAQESGLVILQYFKDKKNYYKNYVFKKG